jgi:hypothetical protein
METNETGMRTEIEDDPLQSEREGSISQIYQVKKTMNFLCEVVPGSQSDLSNAPPKHCKFKDNEANDKNFDFHIVSKPYSESNMSIAPQDGSKRIPGDNFSDSEEPGENSLETSRDREDAKREGSNREGSRKDNIKKRDKNT